MFVFETLWSRGRFTILLCHNPAAGRSCDAPATLVNACRSTFLAMLPGPATAAARPTGFSCDAARLNKNTERRTDIHPGLFTKCLFLAEVTSTLMICTDSGYAGGVRAAAYALLAVPISEIELVAMRGWLIPISTRLRNPDRGDRPGAWRQRAGGYPADDIAKRSRVL